MVFDGLMAPAKHCLGQRKTDQHEGTGPVYGLKIFLIDPLTQSVNIRAGAGISCRDRSLDPNIFQEIRHDLQSNLSAAGGLLKDTKISEDTVRRFVVEIPTHVIKFVCGQLFRKLRQDNALSVGVGHGPLKGYRDPVFSTKTTSHSLQGRKDHRLSSCV